MNLPGISIWLFDSYDTHSPDHLYKMNKTTKKGANVTTF